MRLRSSHLKVAAGLSINIAAGLYLLPFGIRDIGVLTITVIFAMIFTALAVIIEDKIITP